MKRILAIHLPLAYPLRANLGGIPDPHSSTQTAILRAAVQTSERARWLPSRRARSLPVPRHRDKTSPLMFVNLIDEMTPWHIRILQFFQNPEGCGREKGMTPDMLRMGAPAILLERFYPDLGGHGRKNRLSPPR